MSLSIVLERYRELGMRTEHHEKKTPEPPGIRGESTNG